jgi:predicted kinase
MRVGIPGSGKSRIVAELAKLIGQDENGNGVTIVNPDSIREEMTGDAADQSKNSEVWAETYRRMGEMLKGGVSVIVDATFVDKRGRKTFIENCKNNGAVSIAAVVVETDLDIAKKRNSERHRKVPEYVLDNMYERLKNNPVSKAEGINLVSTLSNNVFDPELQ